MVLSGTWYVGVASFPCNSMGKVALKMCAVLFRSRIYVPSLIADQSPRESVDAKRSITYQEVREL